MLYIYLANNTDGFELALSPEDIRRTVGMAQSTYRDQFNRLVDRGYLVHGYGNTYNFYERPKTRATDDSTTTAATPEMQNQCAASENSQATSNVESQNREINNKYTGTNNSINTLDDSSQNIYIPKVKEIVIPRPEAKSKKELKPIEDPKKGEFTF